MSPDLRTCDDCLAELSDPTDRRYRYPFTNCTNCGPRFTVVLVRARPRSGVSRLVAPTWTWSG